MELAIKIVSLRLKNALLFFYLTLNFFLTEQEKVFVTFLQLKIRLRCVHHQQIEICTQQTQKREENAKPIKCWAPVEGSCPPKNAPIRLKLDFLKSTYERTISSHILYIGFKFRHFFSCNHSKIHSRISFHWCNINNKMYVGLDL